MFSKKQLPIISLCILLGMSKSVFSMEENPTGTRIKRDQHFRIAKANPANYAEGEDSFEEALPKKMNQKKKLKNTVKIPERKRLAIDDRYESEWNPVQNTRGYYEGTKRLRINLPDDHFKYDDFDYYTFFQNSLAHQQRIQTLLKIQRKK